MSVVRSNHSTLQTLIQRSKFTALVLELIFIGSVMKVSLVANLKINLSEYKSDKSALYELHEIVPHFHLIFERFSSSDFC